ncbi:hypothetical protein Tco_1085230 [Tanacetum coccineum]
MADNETKCSPSKVCLSYSDNELLIPTPWSDESKNKKKGKRAKGTKVMKDNLSQEHVYKEEVPLNNNIGKVSHDLVKLPSEAVDQGMDDHMPDEIDGVECYTHSDARIGGKKGTLKFEVWKHVLNHGGDELVDKG